MKLICVCVFAYAKSRFSHNAAHISSSTNFFFKKMVPLCCHCPNLWQNQLWVHVLLNRNILNKIIKLQFKDYFMKLTTASYFVPGITCPCPWGNIHVYDHYFQKSLKPLGQSKPNFMWFLLGKRGHNYNISLATIRIYGKTFKISRTQSPMILKLGMQHQGLKLYKVCINDDPGLSLTHFIVYDKVKFGCVCI